MNDIQRRPSSGFIDDIFPFKRLIIYTFLLLLSCVYLPCAATLPRLFETPVLFNIMAFVLTVSGLIFMFTEIKKLGYTIIISVLIFFLYSYKRSFLIPAIFVAAMFIFTLGSYICSLCSKKTYILIALIPVVVYLGSYALTGDRICSLISLIPIPSLILQGVLHKKNAERKTIIVSSVAALIAMCAGFAALLLKIYGRLSISGISETVSATRESIIYFMKNFSVDTGKETVNIFASEYVDAFVTQSFNMLPAIIIVAFLILIYVCHSLQIRLYLRTDFDLLVTEKNSRITMSIYAACIFVLSYILSFSTDTAENTDLLGAVAGNLRVILTPGMFIVGFDALGAILRRFRGFGFMLMLILILSIFLLSQYIILIMAALGAVYVIVTSVDSWAKKHYSKNQ